MGDNGKPCRKKPLRGVFLIGTFVEKSDWEDLESRTGLVVRSGILLQFGDLMEKTLEEDAGRGRWEKKLGEDSGKRHRFDGTITAASSYTAFQCHRDR
jgi:hypothetical protein